MMKLPIDTNLIDPNLYARCGGPPHNLFAAWRAATPVHWNPPMPGYAGSFMGGTLDQGFWVLTRYQDIVDVSRDQKLFSSYEGSPIIWDYEGIPLENQRAGLMGMPADSHLQMKRVLLPAFSPAAINRFSEAIAKVAREIVDGVASKGRCELVFEVASKLPVYTFCSIMGVPPEDRNYIFKLGNATADAENLNPDLDSVAELFAYADRLVREKEAHPDDSLMSALIRASVDGQKLSADQLRMFFVTMSIAGHESTRATTGHFLRMMQADPEQYALLRSDLERYLPNAIDEVLRCNPPVTQFRRTATADTVVGGQQIKKGDKIYLAYAAGNRDPSVFPDPDRFDITRENASKHLAFGSGPHVCVGARLGRMQLGMLLKEFITRMPDYKIEEEPTFLRSIWFSAVTKMNISFEPETVAI